jgi:tetratricopeptide (TPR) repeat protein
MDSLPPLESALNAAAPNEPAASSIETVPADPLADAGMSAAPNTALSDQSWVVVTPLPSVEMLEPMTQESAPRRLPAVEPTAQANQVPLTHERPVTDIAPQEMLERQVETTTQRAAALAARGAYFAARAESLRALRAITQSLDAQQGTREHSEALARAMRAFEEACDFAPRGSRLDAELDLPLIISGHRTPVLKSEDLAHVSPVAAQQRYMQYAQEQLAAACGSAPAGSQALYAPARIYTLMDRAKIDAPTLCVPEAIALHQAALMVNPQNAQAANELGVLLAGCGQWEQAQRLLIHSVSVQPDAAAWRNLSIVHERLGQSELARRAAQQATVAAVEGAPAPADVPVQSVHWVNPQQFSATPSALDP